MQRAAPFPAPPGLDSCVALLRYDDASRALVAGLKYRNARQLVGRFAGALVDLAATELESHGVRVVTWAPTTTTRRRQRGFDHAQLLAQALARQLELPCRPLLVRHPGPAQTGRRLSERWVGPGFSAVGSVPFEVLLVDDVITTGATLVRAAAALRAAGCPAVHSVAMARTSRVCAGGG